MLALREIARDVLMYVGLSTGHKLTSDQASTRPDRRDAKGLDHRAVIPFGRLRAGLLERLERLYHQTLLIPPGEPVARYGYPFRDLYAVRSGHIQASVTYASGYVRILGHYFPGDVIGIDAITRGTYPADFIALERSTVCPLPFHMLQDLAARRHIH